MSEVDNLAIGFGENRKENLNSAYGTKYIWVNDGIRNYRWTKDINNIPNNYKLGMIK